MRKSKILENVTFSPKLKRVVSKVASTILLSNLFTLGFAIADIEITGILKGRVSSAESAMNLRYGLLDSQELPFPPGVSHFYDLMTSFPRWYAGNHIMKNIDLIIEPMPSEYGNPEEHPLEI
jgi:hypothetical protein